MAWCWPTAAWRRSRSTSTRSSRLSTVARDEFGLAGCVQHGASTLPEEAFGHFPAAGCAEIHLATGFQNILYDGGGLPADLRAEMMAWCLANCADERKPGETDEQFLYKTRKKALGPFKEALWSIGPEAEAEIGAHLAARLGLLFERLGVDGTRELVDRYVQPPALPRPMPASLGGAGGETIRAATNVRRRRIRGVSRRPCGPHAAQVARPARRDPDAPHGGPTSGTSATSWSAASPSSPAGGGRTTSSPSPRPSGASTTTWAW